MATYSFVDTRLALIGPGGAFAIGGNGAANAKEGFTVEYLEDKETLDVGADGTPMHSLHASQAGRLTVRLLKTSPVNAQLSALYNFQRQSSAFWGQNTIRGADTVRGDVCSGKSVAFARHPSVTYAADAGMNEWTFNVGALNILLGAGVPDVNL